MLLRFIISAKGQSVDPAQKKGRALGASKRGGRKYAPSPDYSDGDGGDGEGLFSAYAASADYPQPAPSPQAERLLVGEDFPRPEEPAAARAVIFPAPGSLSLPPWQEILPSASPGRASVPVAAGKGPLQGLRCLSFLKQAVVLKEILGRPRGLSDIGEPWGP
jgi:hypothetical protein